MRDNLYQKLRAFNDFSSGYPSATGTGNVMFFDQNQDPPPLYDVVNLVVSALINSANLLTVSARILFFNLGKCGFNQSVFSEMMRSVTVRVTSYKEMRTI